MAAVASTDRLRRSTTSTTTGRSTSSLPSPSLNGSRRHQPWRSAGSASERWACGSSGHVVEAFNRPVLRGQEGPVWGLYDPKARPGPSTLGTRRVRPGAVAFQRRSPGSAALQSPTPEGASPSFWTTAARTRKTRWARGEDQDHRAALRNSHAGVLTRSRQDRGLSQPDRSSISTGRGEFQTLRHWMRGQGGGVPAPPPVSRGTRGTGVPLPAGGRCPPPPRHGLAVPCPRSVVALSSWRTLLLPNRALRAPAEAAEVERGDDRRRSGSLPTMYAWGTL